jgi:cytochrome c-type biogenesis protein CcmH
MQGHADDELSSCKVKQIYYEEVVDMLNTGMSEDEILQSYVDEYGQAALRTPATDKSGLVAWGMPFAGLAAGVAIVALWLRRGKSKGEKEEAGFSGKWESETEKEIAEKMFEEERRKHF